MKLKPVLVGFLLLAAVAFAQDVEIRAELLGPLGTNISRNGDPVSARVFSPAPLAGDTVEGKVTEARSGGRQAALRFTFETLRHGSETVPISAEVKSISNSKGQMNADEEGRLVRRGTSNVAKAAAGTGLGALVGGLAGGGKGAAIGAVTGAAASIVFIELSSDGPSVRFAAGSRVVLGARSRGGPELASLRPNAAPVVATSPVPAAATAAASAPVATAAPAPPATTAAQPAPSASAQPNLAAVKVDFIPGDRTIFLDDFADMASDEPPPHWKVRGGKAELRTGQGVRQLTLAEVNTVLTPNLTAIPKNFTLEADVKYNGGATVTSWKFLSGAGGQEAMSLRAAVNYANLDFFFKVGQETVSSQQLPMNWSQPVKLALWVQNGRLRFYVNGQRTVDANQINLPEMRAPEITVEVPRGWNEPDRHVGFQFVRFAESTPDFSQMISSSGRYVTHGILFDTDSDRIKPESAAVIGMIARGLGTNPNLKLQIEGHTDSTGNADHNLDLSRRRAEAVKGVLVSQFTVDAARLTTTGLGSTKPIDSNDTPTGRAQNRRVEFVRQ